MDTTAEVRLKVGAGLTGILVDREVHRCCKGQRDTAQAEAVLTIRLQTEVTSIGGKDSKIRDCHSNHSLLRWACLCVSSTELRKSQIKYNDTYILFLNRLSVKPGPQLRFFSHWQHLVIEMRY
jgi:hypothetical protein